jgi:hypothetical protein
MGLPTIRRRVRNLESVFVIDRFAGYPPLTPEEIEALAVRMVEDKKWSEEETGRVVRQCPIIQKELLITATRGEVFMKRYLGIDLACI